MPSLHKLLIESASQGCQLQSSDGSMPPGHNGPWGDPETPARNTAHWAVTFLHAFRWSEDVRYRVAADRACSYLVSPAILPMDGAFWCRRNPEKDFSNGLIGQAWVLQALALGAHILERADLAAAAQSVFLRHPYVEHRHLWRNLNVDGSYGPLNHTFNQQLWFAAIGSSLCFFTGHNHQIDDRVSDFFANYHSNLGQCRDGLIEHRVRSRKSILTLVKERVSRSAGRTDSQLLRAVGYHSFNLYGLALAHELGALSPGRRGPDPEVEAALHFAITPGYSRLLEANPYAYAYNPVGIEVAYALVAFADTYRQWLADPGEDARQWVETQLKRHFCGATRLMERNTMDPATLGARLYEATRLPDLLVGLDSAG